jgi:hypothetical protein
MLARILTSPGHYQLARYAVGPQDRITQMLWLEEVRECVPAAMKMAQVLVGYLSQSDSGWIEFDDQFHSRLNPDASAIEDELVTLIQTGFVGVKPRYVLPNLLLLMRPAAMVNRGSNSPGKPSGCPRPPQSHRPKFAHADTVTNTVQEDDPDVLTHADAKALVHWIVDVGRIAPTAMPLAGYLMTQLRNRRLDSIPISGGLRRYLPMGLDEAEAQLAMLRQGCLVSLSVGHLAVRRIFLMRCSHLVRPGDQDPPPAEPNVTPEAPEPVALRAV